MATSLDNAPLAFVLVIAAGLSTAIGAAAVFFQRLVALASKQVLAAGLGFSGGVMLYVSFAEIFVKSQGAFTDAGNDAHHAYMLATLCLFLGMLMLRLLALLVHKIDGEHCHHEVDLPQIRSNVIGSDDVAVNISPGLAQIQTPAPADVEAVAKVEGEKAQPAESCETDKKLQRMGLNTAAAISIHNFPEGLATFVATLAEPSVGATLAIAIAIHNIPEGLCVALPIYYATGSRIRGFLYALLSGISEPVGALIGYAIIKSTGDDMSQTVYGLLFGLVAGMMIMIVLLELLPTGYRYDPQDRYVTNSLVCGMLTMAASLVLFVA